MIIADMPEREYHARPELSSTQAREMLKSPAHYLHSLTAHRESTTTFDVGSAVHAKVLGVGWGIEELDFDSFRSKDAREARDAAREAGLIPMLKKDMHPVNDMAEAVLKHELASVLFEEATGREVSVFSGVDDVPVRCRFDALGQDSGLAIDLKTTLDASLDGFTRSVAAYGYHIQEAHYRAAYKASEGVDPRFVFVAVEKSPPYFVAVHKLSVVWSEMGATAAREARRLYTECVAKDEWPGYPTDIQVLEPPAWSVVEHDMRFDSMEFKF